MSPMRSKTIRRSICSRCWNRSHRSERKERYPLLSRDALDLRPEILEFELEFFVASIQVIDTVDGRAALGGQAGHDQTSTGAKVARHDGRADKFFHAADN